jgi:3,4-dihydroxy 2-butanone 4-phosphate synthase/GTP cyclohydrolase II
MQTLGGGGPGVLVYLGHEGRDIRLRTELLLAATADASADSQGESAPPARDAEVHAHMIALQILKDLGITRVRLLTDAHHALATFPWSSMGIEVVEQVLLPAPAGRPIAN